MRTIPADWRDEFGPRIPGKGWLALALDLCAPDALEEECRVRGIGLTEDLDPDDYREGCDCPHAGALTEEVDQTALAEARGALSRGQVDEALLQLERALLPCDRGVFGRLQSIISAHYARS